VVPLPFGVIVEIDGERAEQLESEDKGEGPVEVVKVKNLIY